MRPLVQGSFVGVDTEVEMSRRWPEDPVPLQASGAVFEMLRQQWLRERCGGATGDVASPQVRHSLLAVLMSWSALRRVCVHSERYIHTGEPILHDVLFPCLAGSV